MPADREEMESAMAGTHQSHFPPPGRVAQQRGQQCQKPENHEALSMIDILRNGRGHASTSRHIIS